MRQQHTKERPQAPTRSGGSPPTGRWRNKAGIFADAVRLAGLLSVVAAVLWMTPVDVVRFSIAFAGLLVPRLFRLPRPFDAVFCLSVLVASWSGAAGWYEAVQWWDWAVHLITNGVIAAAIYQVLARMRVVHNMHDRSMPHSRVALAVLTAAFGLAAGAVWEFMEWIGERYAPGTVHVGYVDSIGDLSAGGLGSIVAGLWLIVWAATGKSTAARAGNDRADVDAATGVERQDSAGSPKP